MAEQGSTIPSYRKPPIIEAVWSVQFLEMPWLLSPHTGIFWNSVRTRFPLCEEHPPIAHIIEAPDVFNVPQPQIELCTTLPPTRQWFLSNSGGDIIQLQRNRFCCNWRKVQAQDVYPRFSYMQELFTYSWDAFCSFVRNSGQSPPVVDQCEMTYTNIIEQGKGWNNVSQVGNVFPTMSWGSSSSFLQPPKTLGALLKFDIPNLNGRLHVTLRHAIKRDASANEVLMLELTARGLPARIDKVGLDSWFAMARDTIVRGFTDLTSVAMHEQWERES
jgi:uncharacterized protein (TIGR04255 family)